MGQRNILTHDRYSNQIVSYYAKLVSCVNGKFEGKARERKKERKRRMKYGKCDWVVSGAATASRSIDKISRFLNGILDVENVIL